MRHFTKHLPLFLILVFHVAAWIILKPVWPFSDDYCYTFYAYDFNLDHPLDLTYNQFQNRLGVYMPVAFFFRIFGITPHSISLWPMIASCITISIVYLFLDKLINRKIAVVAALLIATNVFQIMYSVALFPDLIVSLYTIAAALILFRRSEKKVWAPLLFPIVIITGLITKETMMLIFPFIFIVLVRDLRKKENFFFWGSFIVSLVASGICFFSAYWIITGDPLHLVKTMLDFNNNRLMDQPNAEIMETMFPTNIFSWINDNFGLVFLLIFSVPVFVSIRRTENTFKNYIALYALVLLAVLLLLFFSGKYGPVFLQPRIWMPLIAPLAILSAYTIFEASRRSLAILFILFLVLSIGNFQGSSCTRLALYFSWPLIISGIYFFKDLSRIRFLLVIPFILLGANFTIGNSNYRHASVCSGDNLKRQVDLLDLSGKKTILSAEDFVENHLIYNGFKRYKNLIFFPFSKSDSLAGRPDLYTIVNTEETPVPDFITGPGSGWVKIFDQDKILIFRSR